MRYTDTDILQSENFSEMIWNQINKEYEEMTKKNIETVMRKEHEAGERRYNRLWDALTLLYKLGLVSVSEREIIVNVNHDLSKDR